MVVVILGCELLLGAEDSDGADDGAEDLDGAEEADDKLMGLTVGAGDTVGPCEMSQILRPC